MQSFLCTIVMLALAATTAQADKGAAIDKVIEMLQDMQTQIITEGKAEATTYDKFACFCKDKTGEKSELITEGSDMVTEYTATIGELTAERSDLDDEINEFNSKIEKLEKAMSLEKKRRTAEKNKFLALEAELSQGVTILQNTIADMKATASGTGLLAVRSHLKTVRKALAMMDAMGHIPKDHQIISALLQNDQPMEDYSFHSSGIVSTLENFENEFKQKLSQVRIEATKLSAEHTFYMQVKGEEKYTLEKDLRKSKKVQSQKMKEIAEAQSDLTWASSELTDDQAYLKDLSTICNVKSKEWDQRSKMRTDELTAITSALNIIKENVKPSKSAVLLRKGSRVMSKDDFEISSVQATDEDEAEAPEELAADDDLAFIQLNQPRKHINVLAARMANVSASESLEPYKQALVLSILRRKGEALKSPALLKLADTIGRDPFAKIKKLVQEMIERLLQEAADEASHKGFCDKEMKKAKNSRDNKAAAVASLNSQLKESEAHRDALLEDVDELDKAITELEDSLAKETKMRSEEMAENEKAVTEAQEAKEAVEQAIDLLDKFYKTAANSFVQVKAVVTHKGVEDEIPDAGFSGEYKGSASGGVLGMMDVIKSDFERTIMETQKLEKTAVQDFAEFQTTSKTSISTKGVEKSAKESELTEINSSIAEDKESMLDEQDLLDKAVKTIQNLQPACVETTETYEERVAKREDEIKSLKESLCVLDKEGPAQTEMDCK